MRIIHKHDLNYILAKLVTEIALSFPLKIISNISFYHENKLLASCSWRHSNNKMQTKYQIHDANNSTIILFNKIPVQGPTKAKIAGIDFDDFPFNLYVPTDYKAKRKIFN